MSSMEAPAIAALTAAFVLASGLFLLPFTVAAFRHHRNLGGIFLLNLFLGWTLVGWVVALIWAVMAGQEAARSKPSLSINNQDG